MQRKTSAVLIKNSLTILCLLVIPQSVRAQQFTPVNILIPKFQSSKASGRTLENIGWRAASIIGLQIWRTYSTPSQSDLFDNAVFRLDSESRSPTTIAEAEKLARNKHIPFDLVLWGAATRYGDGIVVETNLLMRKDVGKRKLKTDIWIVTIPTGKSSHRISVDIPRWQYEFAPIVLDRKLVSNLDGLSGGYLQIEIYQLRGTSSQVIATASSQPIKAIRHEGDWSYVDLGGGRFGYIYLPSLSQHPSEVVNFCSGIIRFLRKDWPGAISLFREVLQNSNSPTAIRIDAYLYMAVAYANMHDQTQALSMAAAAYELNPYSKASTQYLGMSYLARLAELLSQGHQEAEVKRMARSLQDLLSKNEILFAQDDQWIRQVKAVVAEL
jgi:tetratricopeptide (TPR) repeat protein